MCTIYPMRNTPVTYVVIYVFGNTEMMKLQTEKNLELFQLLKQR